MEQNNERLQPHTPTPQSAPAGGGSRWDPGETPPSAAGERDAFRALVDTHTPELLRYARRQLGGRAELAEDVLQDAFLNAYRHLSAGTRPRNTRAWLFAIVHNAAINAVRAPQPPMSLEAHHSAAGEHPVAGASTPSEAIEQREWLEWLMGAIVALPARQRDALVGHALEGRSYRELASREQTTVSAVKTLIHRARRGLAEGSPLHALAAPFLLVARRLTGLTAHRALAGKLSANGITGMFVAALGTATLTSGLLLSGQAGHSVAIAASHRQAGGAHAGAHHRHGGGGAHPPRAKRSPAARLHREARRATAECEDGHHPNRRLRVAALQYAASHLTTMQMEYTDCEQILRMRAMRIAGARHHRHASGVHRALYARHL